MYYAPPGRIIENIYSIDVSMSRAYIQLNHLLFQGGINTQHT